MEKKLPALNQPAVFKAIPSSGININTYTQNGTKKAGLVYRYAKNYTFNKVPYCLCMISDVDDSKAVEAFLNKQAKSLSTEVKEHIKSGSKGQFGVEFKYLGVSYDKA